MLSRRIGVAATRIRSASATLRFVAGIFWREARLPGALILGQSMLSGLAAPLSVWAINGLAAVLAGAPPGASPGAPPGAPSAAGSAVLPWLAALGAAFALRSADQAAAAYLVALARYRLQAALQRDVFRHAAAFPLATFEQPSYYQRLEQAQRLFRATSIYILTGAASLLGSVVGVAGLLALFARAHWLLAAFLLATGLLRAIVYARNSARFAQANYGKSPLRREMTYWAGLLSSREAAPEVRLFGLGDTLIGRWRRAFDAHLAAITAARRQVARAALATGLVQELAGWTTTAALLWLALSGAIGAGTLVALLYALTSVRAAIRRIVFAVSELTGYGADLGYLRQFLHQETEPADGTADPPGMSGMSGMSGIPPAPPLRQGVRFQHVGFTYPAAARPALAGIDLTLHPGERIALVGENGAGKSTLVRLLLGLYRPTEGSITVDGVDLASIDPAGWRNRATAVFQDFMRYHTTVAENVAYGDAALLPTLDTTSTGGAADEDARSGHQRIVAAALRSGADAFVRRLPERYATPLGREFGGVDLSSGQWQRLALARAYLRDAKIVVLDEPTAALDPRAEVAVYERFREAAGGRCAVFISHRLGSARLADRIVVLQHGRLVEEGTHETLVRAGGEYARLYHLQAAWYAGTTSTPAAVKERP